MRSNSQTKPAQQILWQPNPGPQTEFLSSPADEVLYGGAAGGGKSAAILALVLRWVANPRFSALVLRRDTTQLRDLLSESKALYSKLGGKLNQTTGTWEFPSGARVWFTHCEHEADVARFDGQAFSLVCFDELTHFTEKQYLAIRARIRSTDPTLPCWTRSTTNPGGPGHEWVFKRWAAWLDPKHSRPAAPARLRWYRGNDETKPNEQDALSRTFIPAKLSDNPHLAGNYRAQLLQLDPVRRAQLLGGDWLVRPAKGLYFKRAWFRVLDAIPSQITGRCRYWDRAASPEGDWTVGARWCRTTSGLFVLEHVVRFRGTPGEVHATLKLTAQTDPAGTAQVHEKDPAQAGLVEAEALVRLLAGFDVRIQPKRSDKIVAAGPASAQAEAGNCAIVPGAWFEQHGEAWLSEHESFPEGANDDCVDTTSGAVSWLASHVIEEAVPMPDSEEEDRWGSDARSW